MRLHLGLSLAAYRTAGGGGVATLTPDIYVDSVNGNNANNGTSLATAKQTLTAGVAALTTGQTLGLARGSYWREQINIPANNITIMSYGTGAMPVIDGADIVTSGWTQPDVINYPNVWSRSWTRSQAATTGSAYLGYWQAGVRTTRHTSLALLQAGANGDWHTTSFTATTATVSIRVDTASNPNSDGILREIGKRAYCINGHPTALGVARTGQTITGPIELKRAIDHYNALTLGSGSASKLLLRDGNIHHSVSLGDQTDVIATEAHPSIAPSVWAFYTSTSAGFSPVVTRLGALLAGGASRPDNSSAFYAHGATGRIDSLTLNGCFSRGTDFVNADANLMTIEGGYCVDAPYRPISFGALNNIVRYMLMMETTGSPFTSSNTLFLTGASTGVEVTVEHCAGYLAKAGATGVNQANNTYQPDYTHCSIVVPSSQFTSGSPNVNYTVCQGARNYNAFVTGYTGNFNVFYFVTQANPQFQLNGVTHGTLSAWQTASGQDAQSVYLKHAEQVSGNGIAFWKALADGTGTGPPQGDFRINPNARVYNGAGATRNGTFADGTTPITMAGPQFHWDFNQRAAVAGPPSRAPTLPTTVAEIRNYLEDPESWNFYP